MPNGGYHVGLTSNPEKYLDDKNKVTGFFSHPRNRGKCKIIKLFKGDYLMKIHCFGAKKFIECLGDEDDLSTFILDLIC